MKVSQPTGSLCFPFVSIEYLHGPTGKKSKQTGVKKLFPPDLAIVNFIIVKLLTLYIRISIQQKNVRVCIVSHFDESVLSISCLFNNNHLSVPFKMAYHFFVIFVLLCCTSGSPVHSNHEQTKESYFSPKKVCINIVCLFFSLAHSYTLDHEYII